MFYVVSLYSGNDYDFGTFYWDNSIELALGESEPKPDSDKLQSSSNRRGLNSVLDNFNFRR